MRAAFEERVEDGQCPFDGTRVQRVVTAAQYILRGGQGLLKHVICLRDMGEEDRKCWKPGPLYMGDSSLSLDRWRFWRRGFMAAGAGGLGGGC